MGKLITKTKKDIMDKIPNTESEKFIEEVRIQDKTITILNEENDGQIIRVEFVDGRKYKLQHPGNRTYKNWSDQSLKLNKGTISTIYLLEQGFKYCVFPEGHDFKPTIDGVSHKHLGVWESLLFRFLDGSLY